MRHAAARAPDDTRLPGADVALTESGRTEASLLAERLAPRRPEAVYCSDARRARETAEAVAARCGVTPLVRAALRELDFGAWAGRTYTEVVAADPGAAAYFRDPTSATPPGGEAVDVAAARVVAALGCIARRHSARGAVVIGHAGSLRLALASQLGMPLTAYWRLRLDTASVTDCEWSDAGLVVRSLNDRAHLAPLTEGVG